MRRILFFMLLLAGTASAQTYPAKAITLVNGFPPGGATDITLRQIAAKLSERVGQPVVIDNRAGAAGTIAGVAVARAAPDGYTLLFGVAANLAVALATMKNPPYDPATAFSPIIEVARGPYIWMAKPAVPAKNLKEFIAWAKANPGKVNYGSPGQGSVHHLASVLFNRSAGLDMVHVPYKGGTTAYTALLGGEIDAMFDSLPAPLSHITAGKIRALGVTGPKRLQVLPDVPTFAKWNIDATPGTPEAFGAYVIQEAKRWREAVASAGLKLE